MKMRLKKNDLDNMLNKVRTKKSGARFWIGIDPGTNTGFAVWDSMRSCYTIMHTSGIVEAMENVLLLTAAYSSSSETYHIVVEDTRKLRLPKNLQSNGRERGMGSVNRDMSIWEEFLQRHNKPHTMAGLSPKEFRKCDAEWFKNKTGWEGRTSEHARAAAGLVYGR